MKVSAIKVSAGRTFNHPFEQFANLRFDMAMEATLEDGEEPEASLKALQARCEELAEGHKQALLQDIRTLERLQRSNREISDLEQRMADANSRLAELRESVKAYQMAPAGPFRLERDADDDRGSEPI